MRISKRLKELASFIDANSYILDVGCDQAIFDIYLLKEIPNLKIIASDINEKPLEIAKKNIETISNQENITLLKADGLEKIDNNIDTVVIAGLGGITIKEILEKDLDKLLNVEKIIISANNNIDLVRQLLTKNNYYIKSEKLVLDSKKLYQIILFEKGKKHYTKIDLKYGVINLLEKDKLYNYYIKEQIKKNKNIYLSIPRRYYLERTKIKKEIRVLTKLL